MKIFNYILCTAFLVAAFGFSAIIFSSAHADSQSAQQVVLVHTPPRASQLPAPGAPLELSLILKKTKDSERKLRIFMVKDGQMMDFSIPSAKFTQLEEPLYTFQTTAPLGELLYQFVLYNPDGTFTVSDRYFVRRSCIPDITLATGKISNQLQGDKRLQELALQSTALERDIENYESVMTLLTQLKKLMGDE